MKVPPTGKFQQLFRGTALFVVGILTGWSLFIGIYHYNIDLVYTRILDLEAQKEELEKENAVLEKNKSRASLISKIDIRFRQPANFQLDRLTEAELKSRIRNDLNVILGRNVSTFKDSYELYEKLIAGKAYPNVLEKNYVVDNRMTVLLVGTELTLWIEIKPYSPHP